MATLVCVPSAFPPSFLISSLSLLYSSPRRNSCFSFPTLESCRSSIKQCWMNSCLVSVVLSPSHAFQSCHDKQFEKILIWADISLSFLGLGSGRWEGWDQDQINKVEQYSKPVPSLDPSLELAAPVHPPPSPSPGQRTRDCFPNTRLDDIWRENVNKIPIIHALVTVCNVIPRI
jgi:hypothetical protein